MEFYVFFFFDEVFPIFNAIVVLQLSIMSKFDRYNRQHNYQNNTFNLVFYYLF